MPQEVDGGDQGSDWLDPAVQTREDWGSGNEPVFLGGDNSLH